VTSTFWQRLDLFARNASPFTFTILLLIVGLVPLRLPYLPPLGINLVLVSVYYWAIHRPGMLPAPALFVVGLFADLLGGGFLGINVLVLLAAYATMVSARRWFVGASFAIVWWGYALVATLAMLATWLITVLLAGGAADMTPGISGVLFGIGAYPLLATFFAHVQRALLR
jgi:rod shape-determining protein MreD